MSSHKEDREVLGVNNPTYTYLSEKYGHLMDPNFDIYKSTISNDEPIFGFIENNGIQLHDQMETHVNIIDEIYTKLKRNFENIPDNVISKEELNKTVKEDKMVKKDKTHTTSYILSKKRNNRIPIYVILAIWLITTIIFATLVFTKLTPSAIECASIFLILNIFFMSILFYLIYMEKQIYQL